MCAVRAEVALSAGVAVRAFGCCAGIRRMQHACVLCMLCRHSAHAACVHAMHAMRAERDVSTLRAQQSLDSQLVVVQAVGGVSSVCCSLLFEWLGI